MLMHYDGTFSFCSYSCLFIYNFLLFWYASYVHIFISGLLTDLQTAKLQLREPKVKLVVDKVSSGASFIGLIIHSH